MIKTLKISFNLRNTYRVNSILFSFKQIPLLKRILPDALYQVKGLKIFANVLSGLWELISTFLGKFLYFLTMVCGMRFLYEKLPPAQVFLHILLFLTLIGSFGNTSLFHPTKDKYYAMMLMRMDAKEYTLINYIYALLKVIIGFFPFAVWFGLGHEAPLWFCMLLPFCIAGMKLTFAAASLWTYEKRGRGFNEDKLSRYHWGIMALLLGAAYGFPALGAGLPEAVSMAVFLAGIPAGILGLWKVLSFEEYRAVNQELLSGLNRQMDTVVEVVKKANEKNISADVSITSSRRGFEYLNELFVRRHKKILWNPAKKISYVCLALAVGLQLFLYLNPQGKPVFNELVITSLPWFLFIMYSINRGTNFTQALFLNCDHSLLTYSFFKQPRFVLKLFQIRLREIMKINAVPALVIGAGLALTLYNSGGAQNPVHYAILIVSILCMSLFFSVHYLTIYYLLQPYNAGTEIKSGTYRIVLSATYLICFFVMQQRVSIEVFGIMTIVFSVLYSIVACILVYRFAPKTFKIRV